MRIRKEQIDYTVNRYLLNLNDDDITDKFHNQLLSSVTFSVDDHDLSGSYRGIIRMTHSFEPGTTYNSRLGFRLGSNPIDSIYLPIESGFVSIVDYDIYLEYELDFIESAYVFSGNLIYRKGDDVEYKQFTSKTIRTVDLSMPANRTFTIRYYTNNNSKMKCHRLTLERKNTYNIKYPSDL